MQTLPIPATPFAAPPVDAAGTETRSPEELAGAQEAFRASLAAAVQAANASGARTSSGAAPAAPALVEPVTEATDDHAEQAPASPGVAEALALLIAAWPGPAPAASVGQAESAGSATDAPSHAPSVAPLGAPTEGSATAGAAQPVPAVLDLPAPPSPWGEAPANGVATAIPPSLGSAAAPDGLPGIVATARAAGRGQPESAPAHLAAPPLAGAQSPPRGAASAAPAGASARLLNVGGGAATDSLAGVPPAWLGAAGIDPGAPTAVAAQPATDLAAPTGQPAGSAQGTAPGTKVAQDAAPTTEAYLPLLDRLVAGVRAAGEQPGQPVRLTLGTGETDTATFSAVAGEAGTSLHVAADTEAARARLVAVWPRLAAALQQDGVAVERLVLDGTAPTQVNDDAGALEPTIASLTGITDPVRGAELPTRPSAPPAAPLDDAAAAGWHDAAPRALDAAPASASANPAPTTEPREVSAAGQPRGAERDTRGGATGEAAPEAGVEQPTTPAAWTPAGPTPTGAEATTRADGPTLAPRPGTPLLDQLADSLRLASDQAGRSVRLLLQPEGLGEVNVRVALGEGGVSVHLAVSNAAAHDLIQSTWPQLSQALQQQGLAVDQLALALGQGPVGGGPGHQPGSQQPAAAPAHTAPHRRPAERPTADEGAARSASQVDYRV
jgi:flagellar hook-length control protein FliK